MRMDITGAGFVMQWVKQLLGITAAKIGAKGATQLPVALLDQKVTPLLSLAIQPPPAYV